MPIAGGGSGQTAVDPAWGPPRRRSLRPLVVIAIVLAVIAGSIFVAERQGRVPVSSATTVYVPADGAVELAGRSAAGAPPSLVATESARFEAGEISSALDNNLAAQVLGAVDLSLRGVAFWRTTTTEVGSEERPQEVRVYRLGPAIELLAESWPGHGLVFHPGLVELPADVAPGHSWGSAGSAGSGLTYTSRFSAEAAAGGCLRVSGRIAVASVTGQRRSPRGVARTWCPGRGIVASIETEDGVTTTTGPGLAGAPGADSAAPDTADSGEPWPTAAAWVARTQQSVSVDPTFGEGPVAGTPSPLQPVSTRSGFLVRAVSGAEDLLVFGRRDQRTWRSLWRMHPGGRILSLASFGDVVVTTTSRRQLIGYSDAGARLWTLDLDEAAFSAPVRLGPDRLAVVDLAGTVVAADIATGVVRWRRTGSDVGVAPASVPAGDGRPGLLLVGDRSGQLTAYEASDGTQRWQLDTERFLGAAGAGDAVLLVDDQDLEAVGLADGQRRWVQPFDGTFRSVVSVAGRAVLSTRAESSLITADGTVRRLPQPYTVVTVQAAELVGWGKRRADLVGADGTVEASVDVPVLGSTSAGRAATGGPDGVLAAEANWTVRSWGATNR